MLILCDIDGVIALNDHRSHLIPAGDKRNDPDAWRTFVMACDKDIPNRPILNMLDALSATAYIHLCTGRMQYAWAPTSDWLARYAVPYTELHMRPEDNIWPNWQVKELMLNKLANEGNEILMAIEDDPETVAMYHRRGINVLHVATRSSCLSI